MERYFKESIDLLTAISGDKEMLGALEACAGLVTDCLKRGDKLMIAGNGGSAADSQHFAAELMGKYKMDRKGFPALALTVDTSMLTAWSNDVGFDTVFSRQIEALGKSGDVFIAITTSGNSANLVEAVRAAKALGVRTIGLLGKGGGELKGACDVELIVPSDDTPRIQEVHQLFFHSICEEVELRLCGETQTASHEVAERQPA